MADVIDDLETKLLDRLVLCCSEISGIKKVYQDPPVLTQDMAGYPFGYFLVGSQPYPQTSSGSALVTLEFAFMLVIWPLGVGNDANQKGAEANVKAKPFYAAVRNYFFTHSKLHTTTLGKMSLVESVRVARRGLTPVGGLFSAIPFDIEVTARQMIAGLG